MSDQEKLTQAANQIKSLNHHLGTQRTYIDEVINQNLVFRANLSFLGEENKRLLGEKASAEQLVKDKDEQIKKLEEQVKELEAQKVLEVQPEIQPEVPEEQADAA